MEYVTLPENRASALILGMWYYVADFAAEQRGRLLDRAVGIYFWGIPISYYVTLRALWFLTLRLLLKSPAHLEYHLEEFG